MQSLRHVLTVRGRPIEWALIGMSLAAGIGGLFDKDKFSQAITAVLPSAYIWYNLCIIISSTLVLSTLLMDLPGSMLMERVGMIWYSGTLWVYGVASMLTDFIFPFTLIVIGLAFGTTCRAIQLSRHIKKYAMYKIVFDTYEELFKVVDKQ